MAPSLRWLVALVTTAYVAADREPTQKGLRIIREHESRSDDWFPQAEHVVRLHRLEGAGAASMLQAEERWARGEHVAPSPFVPVSQMQFDTLANHHHAYHRRASASNSSLLQTARDPFFFTPLEFRTSQYIGPLAVGTKLVGRGCANASLESLEYVPSEDLQGRSNLIESSADACFATEEVVLDTIYDTGSTNFWVASSGCKKGPCSQGKTFDKNHSIDFIMNSDGRKVTISFGSGMISGVVGGQDTIHFGPFTCKHQTLGLIQEEKGDVFNVVEAILGLAFRKMAAPGTVPVFENIIDQKLLKHNMFAFYFSRDNQAKNGILWGGVDKRLYEGDFDSFKVVEPYYWSLKLEGFAIGDQDMLEQGRKNYAAQNDIDLKKIVYNMIVDTGTTFFTAGRELFGNIVGRLDIRPCSKVTPASHPDITFIMKNTRGDIVKLKFTSSEYMVHDSQASDPTCSPAFMQIDVPPEHGPAMLFGEVGIRKYFVVFERNGDDAVVSFANAKHGPETASVLAGLTTKQKPFVPLHQR